MEHFSLDRGERVGDSCVPIEKMWRRVAGMGLDPASFRTHRPLNAEMSDGPEPLEDIEIDSSIFSDSALKIRGVSKSAGHSDVAMRRSRSSVAWSRAKIPARHSEKSSAVSNMAITYWASL